MHSSARRAFVLALWLFTRCQALFLGSAELCKSQANTACVGGSPRVHRLGWKETKQDCLRNKRSGGERGA